jgi:hypothetical protein
MELVIVAALALALGILLGTGVGAALAARVEARKRQMLRTASAFGRLWPETLPERSASDIIAGRIRVVLANVPYDLPVLPRGASRRWLETLDTSYLALGAVLEEAGDDTPAILAAIYAQQDALLDMLLSYDETGVLPAREHLDEYATDAEIFRAVVEVWRAAHPLAATLATGGPSTTSGTTPEPPSSSPMPTAGTLDSWTSA